uniref:Uncharacterized protein n=1 Tax=Anguilla anguilla TaxID=7936 RepID=A0A0E9UNN6_ANGAN
MLHLVGRRVFSGKKRGRGFRFFCV